MSARFLTVSAAAKASPDGMRGAYWISGFGRERKAVWLFRDTEYVPASLQACRTALNVIRRDVPIRFRVTVHSIYYHMSRKMVPRIIPEWRELELEASAFTSIKWLYGTVWPEVDALLQGPLGEWRRKLEEESA